MQLFYTFALPILLSILAHTDNSAASVGCDIAPLVMSNFYWHNSTHNCGCDDGGCPPTGYPTPPGCGPPDVVQANFYQPTFDYNVTCIASDPGSVPAMPIPAGPRGWYSCRSLGRHWSFEKDGDAATVTFVEPNGRCTNGGGEVTYSGSFKLDGCNVDAFGNTSCMNDQVLLPPKKLVFVEYG